MMENVVFFPDDDGDIPCLKCIEASLTRTRTLALFVKEVNRRRSNDERNEQITASEYISEGGACTQDEHKDFSHGLCCNRVL